MTLRYLVNRLVGMDDTSNSGKALKASLLRKWPGNKEARSEESEDKGVKGREFRQASTRIIIVFSSSYVKLALPTARNKFNLIDFIADSQSPPK